MRLLLVRHAIAEEQEDFARTGKDDRLRPLTDEGRKKMKQAARGLRSLVPEIDLLATSPLTRAAQTGAILDSVYGGIDVVEIDELSPETTPEQFLRWLRQQKGDLIGAVGHEPSLSQILGWLLTGTDRRLFAFRKGGACLLEFGDDEPAAGTATLLWALTPAQLRTLAD
ncbi:MAG TPA: histidine phosphatase family protein [Thermoanaerobaculia bacterium]|jgi:phosphohistidine phosphatase|nr:histidine phosphatase family protein [Thermoanaerobaculia bacterium]